MRQLIPYFIEHFGHVGAKDNLTRFSFFFYYLRWYLTLQGDNSVKSAKRLKYVVL